MTMKSDLYELLNVDRTATPQQITAAYRRLSKRYHPDRNPGNAKAAAKFLEIKDAYECLIDSERRDRYDQTGDASERSAFRDDQIFEILRGALGRILADIVSKGDRPQDVDVIEKMSRLIARGEDELRLSLLPLFHARDTWKATIGRFLVKTGSPNILEDVARAEVQKLDQRIQALEAEIAIMQKAQAELTTIEYRVDNPFTASMNNWTCTNAYARCLPPGKPY